jgi:hypothetical protein
MKKPAIKWKVVRDLKFERIASCSSHSARRGMPSALLLVPMPGTGIAFSHGMLNTNSMAKVKTAVLSSDLKFAQLAGCVIAVLLVLMDQCILFQKQNNDIRLSMSRGCAYEQFIHFPR